VSVSLCVCVCMCEPSHARTGHTHTHSYSKCAQRLHAFYISVLILILRSRNIKAVQTLLNDDIIVILTSDLTNSKKLNIKNQVIILRMPFDVTGGFRNSRTFICEFAY
jgi:hypothetical protein